MIFACARGDLDSRLQRIPYSHRISEIRVGLSARRRIFLGLVPQIEAIVLIRTSQAKQCSNDRFQLLFISFSSECRPSCTGSSINALVPFQQPTRHDWPVQNQNCHHVKAGQCAFGPFERSEQTPLQINLYQDRFLIQLLIRSKRSKLLQILQNSSLELFGIPLPHSSPHCPGRQTKEFRCQILNGFKGFNAEHKETLFSRSWSLPVHEVQVCCKPFNS